MSAELGAEPADADAAAASPAESPGGRLRRAQTISTAAAARTPPLPATRSSRVPSRRARRRTSDRMACPTA